MTGYDPEPGAALPVANALTATLTNVASARINGARAQLAGDRAVTLHVTTDGATRIRLSRLPGLLGGKVSVNGKPAGTFDGTVHVPTAGTWVVRIAPGPATD
jgi:hypothetical protein